MLWGAGRLLLHAVGPAARRLRATIWSLLPNVLGQIRIPKPSIRLVALAISILLAAVPNGRQVSSPERTSDGDDVSAVGEPGSFGAGPWGGSLDARAAALDGSDASAQRNAIPAPAQRTALIVGINHAKGGAPLPGSITDATNLRDALVAYGFQPKRIKMLIEGDATAGRIRKELDALARRTPRDGIAVFAAATHTRRRGGRNELLTADGNRISSTELATRLGRVRSRMWVALPTCYAGGYALPGVVGPRRIATFASSEDQQTYQIGKAGSYLMINMVRKAMLERQAPGSVEDAFRYAVATLKKEAPNRVPTMSDGIRGELSLGRRLKARSLDQQVPSQQKPARAPATWSGSSGVDPDEPSDAEPPPNPPPHRSVRPGVCGPLSYNCSSSRD